MPTKLRGLYSALSSTGVDIPVPTWQKQHATVERRRVGQVNIIYRKPAQGQEVLIIRGITDQTLFLKISIANQIDQFAIDQPNDLFPGDLVCAEERAKRIIANLCHPYLPFPR